MKKNKKILVSILIPILDEKKNILKLFNNLQQIIKKKPYQVYFIDGGSKDGTLEILKKLIKSNKKIFILKNKKKTTQYAFKLGLKKAKTEYIALFGAHTNYPKNYIDICLKEIKKFNAVGCSGKTKFIKNKNLSSILSNNILQSNFGTSSKSSRNLTEGYVKILPYPVYKRKIISKVGGFDDKLVRNQDNNLSNKIINNGYKLYLTFKTYTKYHGPKNFKELMRYSYKYGYGNGQMIYHFKTGLGLRHVVPLFFSLMIVIFLTLSIISSNSYLVSLFQLPVILYFLLNFYFSLKIYINHRKLFFILAPLYFFFFHFTYGISTLLGLLNIKIKVF
jgi:cellulose synthase/poly-beta-1,6-N-acetylglucosamine synthase-like glycosyltransferase